MLRFFVIVVGGAVLLCGSASADDRCDLVKQAVATYGYAAARQHALENYGQEAVAFGDKCLGASTVRHGRAGRRVAGNPEIGSGVTSLRADE